jgi:hypothetical protein
MRRQAPQFGITILVMRADATDIEQWAARLVSEAQLPILIRRLIFATANGVRQAEFRAGEGIRLPGWDGIVDTDGADPFVPQGTSRWELNTWKENKRTKADSDYEKRTANPIGIDPAQATYVHVTAWRWAGKNDWVTEKRAQEVWRDVRAYDADSLEEWLWLAPAAHVWFSRFVGKHPRDASDLDAYWDDWQSATNPSMTVGLTIGGREDALERVLKWFVGETTLTLLQAETEAEAVAFVGASLESLPPDERDRLLARVAIVTSDETWRELSNSATPTAIIARNPDQGGYAAAVGRGHRVLVPLARNQPGDERTIVLPEVDREAARLTLLETGIDEARASELAGLAWRGLSILRREIAISRALMRPPWAAAEHARPLVPAILAGRWDESSEGDVEVVSALAGVPYPQFREVLFGNAFQPDAPVKRIGEVWLATSRKDSWSVLSGYVTRPELDRLVVAAKAVLGEVDPRFDLPPDQQFAAAVYGKVLSHSTQLREGLAETVAMLGAYGGVNDQATGQQWACLIVRDILASKDWRLWASLAGQLPVLAEACPDAFMDAVEVGIDEADPYIGALFRQNVGMFGSSPESGLLAALERLSWPPHHLTRAALLLARLSRITDA